MRSVRSLGAGLLLAFLVGACGGGNSAREESVTVGLGADEYVVEGASANLGLGSNITETLIALTPDYGLQPLLAERWEFRPPNTWRFFLRRGVTFHNGQPLDARAVKEGLFDRVANPEFGGTTIGAGPDSVTVIDDFTLDFTPTEPNLRVPQQMVHPVYGVFAPGSDPGTQPVGTGPFEFVSYSPQERLVVKRYDGYWGEKAESDGLTFRFYPESEVRRLALEAGEIDLATLIRPADVAELEGKGFRIARSKVGAYDALYANIHKPDGALSVLPVRQAVASAIDRKAIVEELLEGQATADPTMVPPDVLGPHASMVKGVPYEPVKAESLLDQAGWAPGPDGVRQRDGRRLVLTLAMGSPPSLRPVAEFVQAQLGEVGIAVEIAERPDPVSYGEMITSGAGDLYLEEGNQNDANPAFLPVVLFYGGSQAEQQDYQALFAPGPAFDQLLAPALTEEDADRVQMAAAAAMHNIVDEQAVVIPLAGIYGIYGLDENVEGFVPYPSFVNTRWDRVRR